MNNDIYDLVTVTDSESDAADIVKVFSKMATGRLRCDLKLLNYYDGVPVSYDSTITAVDKDSVELAVHEDQALIMQQDKYSLIRCRHFDNGLGVHCHVASVDVPKKSVILNNMTYAQIRMERRKATRVKVCETLPVTFYYENFNIKGWMADISGNGISIISERAPATNTDQSGLLYFTLNGTHLAVPGSFVRATTNERGVNVCMFQMQPDRMIDNLIGQFICRRQVEMIQQLKDGLVVG